MYEKSSRLSAAYREKGNASYKNRDFFEALVFYNKALAFAESKEDLSLAYANRSAVYLEVKKYDLCLQNIKWARENNYQKSQVLTDRERKCKKHMQADNQKAQGSFFKLSYAANPKIPFIVENLYMKETPEFGRGIYAATDLKTGDVIAIETPAVTVLYNDDDARFKHCCYCIKSCMMSLIPCLKTAAVMFCSDECRSKVYKRMNKMTDLVTKKDESVLNAKRLLMIIREAYENDILFGFFIATFDKKDYSKTVFDYDLSNPKNDDFKANILDCFLALASKPQEERLELKDESSQKIINCFDHLAGIIQRNAIGMQYQEQRSLTGLNSHGMGAFNFGALFNHSCIENVDRVPIDNKIAFIVSKPIKANEQLFISYRANFYNNGDRVERLKKLKEYYNFDCRCDACLYDYDEFKLIRLDPFSSSQLLRSPPKTYNDALNELREHWKYIEDHADKILALENYDRMQRNTYLLYFLANLETFPR